MKNKINNKNNIKNKNKGNNNKLKIIILTFIAVIIIFFLINNKTNNSNKNPQEIKTIKIGLVGPLSSEVDGYGIASARGVEMAADNINSKGGINGYKIQLVKEDTKCNSLEASNAANKLVNVDKIQFIIGGMCSSETLAMIPITQHAKVILLSPLSTSYKISMAGDYVFRNVISDKYSAESFSKIIKNRDNNLAILSENTDYARDLAKVLKDNYVKEGGKIISEELYNANDKDWKTLVKNTIKSKPKSIFVSYQNFPALFDIIKELKNINYKGNIYTAELPAYRLEQNPDVFEGVIIVRSPLPNFENENYKNLASQYKNRYGQEVNYPDNFANGYDAMNILSLAITNAGQDTIKVNDYLHNLKDYKGWTGTYSFNNNGDIEGLNPLYKKVVQNKFVDLK